MREAPPIRTTARRTLAVLAVGLAIGCNPARTAVTQVWQAPVPAPAPLKSLMVFGSVADEASRRSLEDRFAAELAKHDVRALRSYEYFPTPPAQDQARRRLRDLDLDGVLVVKLKGTSEQKTYAPSRGGFWSVVQGPRWQQQPGYLSTDATVTFETTLWDANADDKLLWAVSTTTKNPFAGRGVDESLARTVVAELDGAGRIPPASRAQKRD